MKIIELMVINKKEGSTSTRVIERLILGLCDNKKVGGIPNENLRLVITTTISNFDISWCSSMAISLVTLCTHIYLMKWGCKKRIYGPTKDLTCWPSMEQQAVLGGKLSWWLSWERDEIPRQSTLNFRWSLARAFTIISWADPSQKLWM